MLWYHRVGPSKSPATLTTHPPRVQRERAEQLAASLPALPEEREHRDGPHSGPLTRRQEGAEPPPEWDTLSDDARELVAHSLSPQHSRPVRPPPPPA